MSRSLVGLCLKPSLDYDKIANFIENGKRRGFLPKLRRKKTQLKNSRYEAFLIESTK